MAPKRLLSSGATLFLLAGFLLATSSAQSIFQVINSTSSLALLTAGIQATGLVATLSDPTLKVTLFAPSNEALLGVLTDLGVSQESLLALGATLAPVFQYHVIQTALNASEIPSGDTSLPTLLAGANLTITKSASGVTVKSLGADANVIQADLIAGGSTIHIVDTVLLPFFVSIASALSRSPALSTLLTAVQSANLTATFSDPALVATVFAPSNAAFDATLKTIDTSLEAVLANPALLSGVLAYHAVPQRILAANITTAVSVDTLYMGGLPVAPGKQLSVAVTNGSVVVSPLSAITATVLVADIPIGLGPRSVVHVVDQVLLPFYSSVANAAQRNSLSTLLAAVAADGRFVTALNSPTWEGTILAPTDAAFSALLAKMRLTAAQLLSDRATLAKILELHVVPSVLKAAQITNGPVTTLSAAPLRVNKTGTTVTFTAAQSTARVIVPDVSINLDTAIVHVIDQVLLPANVTVPTAGSSSGGGAAVASPSSAFLALCGMLGAAMLYTFAGV